MLLTPPECPSLSLFSIARELGYPSRHFIRSSGFKERNPRPNDIGQFIPGRAGTPQAYQSPNGVVKAPFRAHQRLTRAPSTLADIGTLGPKPSPAKNVWSLINAGGCYLFEKWIWRGERCAIVHRETMFPSCPAIW